MMTVEKRVIAALGRAADLAPDAFAPDTPLASLGIGSLERIECMLALEDDLQVELPDADLQTLRTVQDVIDAVQRAVAAAPRRAGR